MGATAETFAVIASCSDGHVRQIMLNEIQHSQLAAVIVAICGSPVRVFEAALPVQIEEREQRKVIPCPPST